MGYLWRSSGPDYSEVCDSDIDRKRSDAINWPLMVAAGRVVSEDGGSPCLLGNSWKETQNMVGTMWQFKYQLYIRKIILPNR